jgi:hypothetical protein
MNYSTWSHRHVVCIVQCALHTDRLSQWGKLWRMQPGHRSLYNNHNLRCMHACMLTPQVMLPRLVTRRQWSTDNRITFSVGLLIPPSFVMKHHYTGRHSWPHHNTDRIQTCHCRAVGSGWYRARINWQPMHFRAWNFNFSSPQFIAACQRTREQDKVRLPSPTRSSSSTTLKAGGLLVRASKPRPDAS